MISDSACVDSSACAAYPSCAGAAFAGGASSGDVSSCVCRRRCVCRLRACWWLVVVCRRFFACRLIVVPRSIAHTLRLMFKCVPCSSSDATYRVRGRCAYTSFDFTYTPFEFTYTPADFTYTSFGFTYTLFDVLTLALLLLRCNFSCPRAARLPRLCRPCR